LVLTKESTMWRQRKLARQIRERELRKLLARPPEPPPAPAEKPEDVPVAQQAAEP
jgi:hypothetical protein